MGLLNEAGRFYARRDSVRLRRMVNKLSDPSVTNEEKSASIDTTIDELLEERQQRQDRDDNDQG